MKIAIAGFGDVGRYFAEEFVKAGEDVVVLTRKAKDPGTELKKVEQRITKYTVDELTSQLADCDAVVSTLSGPDDAYISAHLNILEACTRSVKCKRFLPSEYTTNIEDFPDMPTYIARSRGTVREALRSQKDVRWTLVANGWFMDYLLPTSQRYLMELGNGWVTNNTDKVFDMYGDGLERISMTSVRDVARVVLALLKGDANEWREYSMVAGQTLTYVELFELLKKRDPSWTMRKVSFSEVFNSLMQREGGDAQFTLDCLRILGFTRCNDIPEARSLEWGTGILAGVQGRDVNSFLDEAVSDRGVVP